MEWVTIISTLLLPMLAKCWGNQGTDPQEYLKANYNSTTGRMNPDVVNAALPTTRRAMHKAKMQCKDRRERRNFPAYNKAQIYELAEKNLIDAMNANDEKAMAVYEAADKLGDEG